MLLITPILPGCFGFLLTVHATRRVRPKVIRVATIRHGAVAARVGLHGAGGGPGWGRGFGGFGARGVGEGGGEEEGAEGEGEVELHCGGYEWGF